VEVPVSGGVGVNDLQARPGDEKLCYSYLGRKHTKYLLIYPTSYVKRILEMTFIVREEEIDRDKGGTKG